MSEWKIFYADGTTYTGNCLEDVYNAPPLGVICILQPDVDHGWHIIDRFDFYWWKDNEWFGGEIFGLWEYLAFPGPKSVKFGRTITNDRFREIHKEAAKEAKERRGN